MSRKIDLIASVLAGEKPGSLARLSARRLVDALEANGFLIVPKGEASSAPPGAAAPAGPRADDPIGDPLTWMLRCAKARNANPKARTVDLKFSWATLEKWIERAEAKAQPGAAAPSTAPAWEKSERAQALAAELTPKANLAHDAGAIAQCGRCSRYTLNLKALSRDGIICDCGERNYWSGSFKPPTSDSKWFGPSPSFLACYQPPSREAAAQPGAAAPAPVDPEEFKERLHATVHTMVDEWFKTALPYVKGAGVRKLTDDLADRILRYIAPTAQPAKKEK